MLKIIEAIRDRQSGLAAIRRDIHAHPETAFAELRTAEVIGRHLERSGIEVHRGMAKTGVIGVLRAGSSRRAIGLRADMDALPIQERNTVDALPGLSRRERAGRARDRRADLNRMDLQPLQGARRRDRRRRLCAQWSAQGSTKRGPLVCGSMESVMTAQDLALFCIVCVSPAVVAVGMVATCIALTRGVLR